ncbi:MULTISPECIES: MFS transporter [unclassified Chelatococcus]|uniref:MFS transporter n=1 Tax=unclassified Chelatococcus TaxID=2638111 RepID=UPI0003159A23|nr:MULTISPECIES: MFS transporter [unclassified Chelatococcus]
MQMQQSVPGTPSGKAAPVPLRALLAAAGATTAMAFGFGALALPSVFIRPLEAEFGWSRADLSLAYTLSTVGMALGGLFWGRLSDRLDARILLACGSAAMVAALGAFTFAQSLWHLYAASLVLGGLGFACLYAPVLSVTALWFERRRGLAMGIVTAGGALGQGVMPYTANLLIDSVGWRPAYAILAAATLVALGLLMPAVRRPPVAMAPPVRAAGTGSSGDGRPSPVLLLAAAAFLCCACMGFPLVHLASFVTAVCGSSDLGSTSLLVAMLFGTVGRVAFGLLADRIGNLPAYATASFMQTACVAIYPLLDDQISLLALSAVFGFGFAGNMTCLILCVREFVPAERFGQALGTVMMVAWAGMGVGGYLGGLAYDGFASYTPAFLIAFAAGVANLATIAMLAAGATTRGKAAPSGLAPAPSPSR